MFKDINIIGMYLSPIIIMVSNSYFDINSYCVFLMPLITILISFGILLWKGKYVEV